MKIQDTVTIDRAAEDIWAYLVDVGNYREWQRDVSAIKQVTPGRVRAGSEFRETRALMMRRVESTFAVTEYEHQRKLAVKGGAADLQFEARLTCEAVWGGTRVNVSAEATPSGFFRSVEPLFARAVNGQVREALKRLQRIMESNASKSAS